MEATTTIQKLLREGTICVPNYQRAYSWGEEQIKTFISDLENHKERHETSETSYYFGHFLFENKEQNNARQEQFAIIDGQQRLTTIIIFLSTLCNKIKEDNNIKTIEELKDTELKEIFEDMIKRNSTYRFATVEYDNQFFKDYVIDRTRIDTTNLQTISSKK